MRRWIPLLIVVCLITGCSYNRAEPGHFGRSITRETTAPPIRSVTPDKSVQTPNPDLPVIGEATWTSADGLDITMRLAVHAVRRVPGGTVLDWSVTPLHGSGFPASARPECGCIGRTANLLAGSRQTGRHCCRGQISYQPSRPLWMPLSAR
jgi:hypothetical protein